MSQSKARRDKRHANEQATRRPAVTDPLTKVSRKRTAFATIFVVIITILVLVPLITALINLGR